MPRNLILVARVVLTEGENNMWLIHTQGEPLVEMRLTRPRSHEPEWIDFDALDRFWLSNAASKRALD